ncbi:MAG: response regulator [Desulfobacteraceae bacterium]|nr:response regulator [Desulfobacteraceae bacterium]MBC2755711.1 response regulator [Desulfobacteraceae bacterium]
MSHEIRTPLNAVVGSAELLKDAGLPAELQSIVDMLQINSEMLLKIISDILDISKIESGKTELEHIEFNLNIHTEKICKVMEIRVRKKGIELRRNIDPDLPWIVKGDPVRLQQVLMNLIDNAVKFTALGYITVGCGYAPDDPAEFIFSVSDTGIGISESKQESIFQNFSQADTSTTRKFGGTGLGLTISRHLVELMGGRIWIKSKRGQGSTFYFSIRPEVVSMEKMSGQQLDDTEKKKTKKNAAFEFHHPGRILLADDYEYNQTIVLLYLKGTPIKIDIATNGAEAVEKYKNKKYNLILMDLQMPVMDGYDATREIRKIENEHGSRSIPIIALSAFALKAERQKSYDAGCDEYLSKPVKKDDLLAMMARYLK